MSNYFIDNPAIELFNVFKKIIKGEKDAIYEANNNYFEMPGATLYLKELKKNENHKSK